MLKCVQRVMAMTHLPEFDPGKFVIKYMNSTNGVAKWASDQSFILCGSVWLDCMVEVSSFSLFSIICHRLCVILNVHIIAT